MASLVIELPSREEQTEFNLRRWREICEDPVWEQWEGRIETDRHGNVIMTPLAEFHHADRAAAISRLLESILEDGHAYQECPISTADGVKGADVVWLSHERKLEGKQRLCLTRAPEICVEVISPRNRPREMAEKKALYFGAGAMEVWFCDRKGKMTFFTHAGCEGKSASIFCPNFPRVVTVD